MFKKIIDGILGVFGFNNKYIPYKKTDKKEFLRAITPGSIVLTRKIKPGWVSRLISGFTNSAWTHSVNYWGKSEGEKNLPHECVEAIGEGVIIMQLEKYLTGEYQLEVWSRPLTKQELYMAKKRCYGKVGTEYDWLEFTGHGIPGLPNDKNLVVCATLSAFEYLAFERIVKKKVDVNSPFPKDLRDYFMINKRWTSLRFGF